MILFEENSFYQQSEKSSYLKLNWKSMWKRLSCEIFSSEIFLLAAYQLAEETAWREGAKRRRKAEILKRRREAENFLSTEIRSQYQSSDTIYEETGYLPAAEIPASHRSLKREEKKQLKAAKKHEEEARKLNEEACNCLMYSLYFQKIWRENISNINEENCSHYVCGNEEKY